MHCTWVAKQGFTLCVYHTRILVNKYINLFVVLESFSPTGIGCGNTYPVNNLNTTSVQPAQEPLLLTEMVVLSIHFGSL